MWVNTSVVQDVLEIAQLTKHAVGYDPLLTLLHNSNGCVRERNRRCL